MALASNSVALPRDRHSDAQFVDTDIATVAVTYLTNIARGTTASSRLGLQVQLLSCQVAGFVQDAGSAARIQGIYLVLDRQHNGGANPTVTDIFTSGQAGAFINPSVVDRFEILDAILVGPTTATAGSLSPFVMDVDLTGIVATFNNGVAGTSADSVTNSLYLVVQASDGGGGVGSPIFRASARVRFYA